MSDEPVVVYVAQGEVEEAQVRSFLEANGIATASRGEALRKTHALTLDGLGAAEILVAAGDADRARELLADAEKGSYSLDDES